MAIGSAYSLVSDSLGTGDLAVVNPLLSETKGARTLHSWLWVAR